MKKVICNSIDAFIDLRCGKNIDIDEIVHSTSEGSRPKTKEAFVSNIYNVLLKTEPSIDESLKEALFQFQKNDFLHYSYLIIKILNENSVE